ncbi:uncharacterized protein LOC134680255 [Cydia fagiglandana]|uniref:uncharacterized protein LOC134680255 n=1 Tax=Cydia fagiglandana TaxID=1458189 RepID=UPI002FEDF6D8
MPTCVIKCCKNYTDRKKKRDGITFHRINKENKDWTNRLVDIIRKCRHETDWIPSKSSVICSVHFDANDFYTSKGGRLYLVSNAIPKKFLEPSNRQEQYLNVTNTCNFFQKSRLETESILIEEKENSNTKINIDIQNKPVDCEEASDINIENPMIVLYSPKKRNLKESLIKKEILVRKLRKKLRTANQNIKRLQSRNKSLKDILKNLKENNLIDTDLFGKLNEDIIAVNLFNNYNRKKLKKNIKYSPVIKKFCLTLNYYSPKAYDYVRDTFNTCLPHRKTLSKWYGNLKGDPGFTEESFKALKAKSQMSENRPLCSLIFDEVAIRPQPICDDKDDTLEFMEEISGEARDLAKRLDVDELNNFRELIIGYLAVPYGLVTHTLVEDFRLEILWNIGQKDVP